MRLFDRTFVITRVLRLLAAVIAFAVVFSALLALELERTRELGLFRALGMTPAGLSGLLVVETGVTGLIAGLLSVSGSTLVYVLYERCFGWSMDLPGERGARGRPRGRRGAPGRDLPSTPGRSELAGRGPAQ